MDLRLPDMNGIDAMIAIRTEFGEARIIILTTFEGDVESQRALEAGARGYLLKSMPPKDLLEGIRQVHAGKKRIPPEIVAHHGQAGRPRPYGRRRDRLATRDHPALSIVLRCRHDDVEAGRILCAAVRAPRLLRQLQHERVLHPGIPVQVLVAFEEYLGDERRAALVADDQMNVPRSRERPQRIVPRENGVDAVAPFGIRSQPAAQAKGPRLRGIAKPQHVRVEPARVGLPDVEQGGREWAAGRKARHDAGQHERLTRLVRRAETITERCALPVERSSDVIGGGDAAGEERSPVLQQRAMQCGAETGR